VHPVGAATTSAPLLERGSYFGPAAIVNAHRHLRSRDEAPPNGYDTLNEVDGVWPAGPRFTAS